MNERAFFLEGRIEEETVYKIIMKETQEYPEKESGYYVEARKYTEEGKEMWALFLAHKDRYFKSPMVRLDGKLSLEEVAKEARDAINDPMFVDYYEKTYFG